MATITKRQAVDRLTQAVREAHSDDLVEIHNELFPEKPTTEDEAKANPAALVKKIVAHIDNGLELEEILDLWHVIFPKNRRVWFDEDEGGVTGRPLGSHGEESLSCNQVAVRVEALVFCLDAILLIRLPLIVHMHTPQV